MLKRLTENKEIAAAVGFAGGVTRLAHGIGSPASTVRHQIQRGFLSFEVAQRVAAELPLDIQALQTKPSNAGTARS